MSRPARAVDSLLLRRPAAAVVLGFAVVSSIDVSCRRSPTRRVTSRPSTVAAGYGDELGRAISLGSPPTSRRPACLR